MAKQEQLDDQWRSFTSHFGMAFWYWRYVEWEIKETFILLIASEKDEYASVAFYSVVAFSSKLAVVDELMKYRFEKNKRLLEEWAYFKDRISKSSRMRNNLAHWTLDGVATTRKRKTRWLDLSPPRGDLRVRQRQKILRPKDLRQYIENFGTLYSNLVDFNIHLKKRLASQRKSSLRLKARSNPPQDARG